MCSLAATRMYPTRTGDLQSPTPPPLSVCIKKRPPTMVYSTRLSRHAVQEAGRRRRYELVPGVPVTSRPQDILLPVLSFVGCDREDLPESNAESGTSRVTRTHAARQGTSCRDTPIIEESLRGTGGDGRIRTAEQRFCSPPCLGPPTKYDELRLAGRVFRARTYLVRICLAKIATQPILGTVKATLPATSAAATGSLSGSSLASPLVVKTLAWPAP